MTTFVFSKDDADAPRLSGTAGDLINLFTKCFVDGYNVLASVTVTRSGSTATFNKTAHGFITGQIVRHSGFTETEYNVDAKVTRIDANNWSITVAGTPATPGAIAGGAKMCPIGWTKPYTGTNLAAFQMPAGTNQFYLRVDEATDAQNAVVRGYEAMTAVSTGTNPFPTIAQVALTAGLFVYKSTSANTTAKWWQLVSDGKFFWLSFSPSSATRTVAMESMYFGDGVPLNPADAYFTVIGANPTSYQYLTNTSVTLSPSAVGGSYLARNNAGAAGALNVGRVSGQSYGVSSRPGVFGITYPSAVEGGMILDRITVYESSTVGPRGYLPGYWAPCHPRADIIAAAPDTTTFSGASGTALAGRTFEVLDLASGNAALVCVEKSDTWRT